jgi:hypothetical protein
MNEFAKRVWGSGRRARAAAWLHNPFVQAAILVLVPGILAGVVCYWMWNQVSRRYGSRVRIGRRSASRIPA